MSASFDDDTTGRRQQPPPLTHDPTRSGHPGDTVPQLGAPSEHVGSVYAPPPAFEPGREQANAPIVQAGSVTGKSLTLVIAIMCFLACLTAGAVYLINQSATAWLRDVATEVTVQVEPSDTVEDTGFIEDLVAAGRVIVRGEADLVCRIV